MTKQPPRRPGAFRLDDPHVIVAERTEDPAARGDVRVTPEADAVSLPVPVPVSRQCRHGRACAGARCSGLRSAGSWRSVCRLR